MIASIARHNALVICDDEGLALGVIRILARDGWDSILVTSDLRSYAAASRYCKQVILLTELCAAAWKQLRNALRPISYDLVFPVDILAIEMIAQLPLNLFQSPVVPIPSREALEVVNDRVRFTDWCIAKQIQIPRTIIAREPGDFARAAREIGFPLVLKWGEHEKMYLASSANPFPPILPQHAPVVVQHYVHGTDIDMNILADRGEILRGCCQRNEKPPFNLYGRPYALSLVKDDEVETIAQKIMRELSYDGLAHIDMRRDEKTGIVFVFEVNPRLWSSHIFVERALGWSVPQSLVHMCFGETLQNFHHPDGRVAIFISRVLNRFGFAHLCAWMKQGIMLMPMTLTQDLSDMRPVFARMLQRRKV